MITVWDTQVGNFTTQDDLANALRDIVSSGTVAGYAADNQGNLTVQELGRLSREKHETLINIL